MCPLTASIPVDSPYSAVMTTPSRPARSAGTTSSSRRCRRAGTGLAATLAAICARGQTWVGHDAGSLVDVSRLMCVGLLLGKGGKSTFVTK